MKLSHQQNIRLVIFDFDGTIADTSEGILDAYRYTLESMGVPVPDDSALRTLIGGALLKNFCNLLQCNEETAKEAVQIYRKRYSEVGIHKAELYPGIGDALARLKDKGLMIGMATLKAQVFAEKMLEEMGIRNRFDCVCGMDQKDTTNKPSLIQKCMRSCNCKESETVVIGDSNNDYEGAIKAGTHFIGVLYGFGFKMDESYAFPVVKSPDELMKSVLQI